MRTIEIDFEVHQLIELERRSFAETPNEALRRRLKLPEPKPATIQNAAHVLEKPTAVTPTLLPPGAWQGGGVTLKHGTELRMIYRGTWHFGSIQAGSWIVEGKTYSNPSTAAVGCAVTKDGTHPSLNGWLYWQAKQPGDNCWTPLRTIRSFYADQTGRGVVEPYSVEELGCGELERCPSVEEFGKLTRDQQLKVLRVLEKETEQ
jgi:hypothetical protein